MAAAGKCTLMDADLVVHVFYSGDSFSCLFSHPLHLAALHVSSQRHFSSLDLHFDLGGIYFGMLR